MKKLLLYTVLVIPMLFMTGAAQAAVTQKVDGLTISLATRMDKLSMGVTQLAVTIVDSSGREVTDARVKVGYGMTAMKHMAKMRYRSPAGYADGAYNAKLNINMGGSWYITVTVLLPSKKVVTATFDYDVGAASGSHGM